MSVYLFTLANSGVPILAFDDEAGSVSSGISYPNSLPEYRVSPDSLLSVGVNNTAYRIQNRVWTRDDAKFGVTTTLVDVAFHPDSSVFAVLYFHTPRITFISPETLAAAPVQPVALPNTVNMAHFSPDGSILAVGFDTTSPRCRFIDVATGATLTSPTIANSVKDVRFSPDGGMVAFAHVSSPTLSVRTYPGLATVSTGYSAITPAGYSCDWSPDGRYLAFCIDGGSNPIVFDTQSSWAQVPLTALSVASRSCRFSPDGKYLAVSYTGTAESSVVLRIYRVADWAIVHERTRTDTGTAMTKINWVSRHVAFLNSGVSYSEEGAAAQYPVRFFDRKMATYIGAAGTLPSGLHHTPFIFHDEAADVAQVTLHDSTEGSVCNDLIHPLVLEQGVE